jgi:AGZA family xanthine/uracil permease-like MFS transporter
MLFFLRQELKDFKNGLSMTGGDWGSLSQLFFDNLSTLLGALFAIQSMTNFGVTRSVIDEVIFGKIVPGVGVTLVVGNIYYSWQAVRLTNKWGRQYTAQPYGLNTPAAFAFIFNIIYTVYFDKVGDLGPDAAFLAAYKVALAANFITGLISVFLGFFGRAILKAVPPAALLVPIGGIGVAFLGLEQLSNSLAAPLVGYQTIMWVFLGWYSGLNDKQGVSDAAELVKWWGPVWSANDLFEDFSEVKDYLGIVIPIGISAGAGTLMCLVSAKEAGDPFPVHESMISDGIGTIIASFFGSPFGTVIYIGHPAYKRSGAKVGYSLANGCIYL